MKSTRLRLLPQLGALPVATVLLLAAPARAFDPDAFLFEVVIPDDGQGKAGGWQEARATLRFGEVGPLISSMWVCRMRIGMPLRTTAHGRISAAFAAQLTAPIATDAASRVMHSRDDWLTADFCRAFKDEMNELFLMRYEFLGARANYP